MKRRACVRLALTVCTFMVLVVAAVLAAPGGQKPDTPKGRFLEAQPRIAPDVGETVSVTALESGLWSPGADWSLVGDAVSAAGTEGVAADGAAGLATARVDLPAVDGPSGRLLLEFSESFSLESDYDYGVVSVSLDDGVSWVDVDRRTGAETGRDAVVDLTSYAGTSVLLGLGIESDDSVASAGWTVEDVRITSYADKAVSASLVNINHVDFPHIFMNVSVRDEGVDILDLGDGAFSVFEDDVPQTASFDVVPPSEGGGVRVADIVFVLDLTTSMDGEIAAVKANMTSFITALTASSIDYRIGFVYFWDYVEVVNDGNLYAEYDQIMAIINGLHTAHNGNYDMPENSLEAMVEAGRMNFRPGAHRVQIMLTDAEAHQNDWATSWTVATTIDQLLASGSVVYPVFNTAASLQLAQYRPIAQATNPDGGYYHIFDNFNGIISSIQESIAQTYVVRYRTTNGAIDGLEREVRVVVDAHGDVQEATGSYVPGASPVIVRTPETVALSDRSWAERTPLTITAMVTDPLSPGVSGVTLFYRQENVPTFASARMTGGVDGLYEVDLPLGAVADPGFRYYISATDGVNVVTAPEFEPDINAYSVGVLPNELPVITLTPPSPSDLTAGQSFVISAHAVDETNELVSVSLSYKPVGLAVWTDLPMAPWVGDRFTATIPGVDFPVEGVEVQLKAFDDIGPPASTDIILIRAWETGGDDLLVFHVEALTGDAKVRSVRVMGNTDFKALHTIAEKPVDDGGLVRFSVDDLDEMDDTFSGFDEEIRRIELMGGPDDVVGHINFHYTSQNYGESKKVEAFLFLHDLFGDPFLEADNTDYLPFFSRNWEDYDPADEEYFVSMLVPPGGRVRNIDAANRPPAVLVHGVYGYYPYWYETDADLADLDSPTERKGGLPYHLDAFDTWSFYYPFDIRIRHASTLFGRALKSLLVSGGIAGTGDYADRSVAVVAHSMGGLVVRGCLESPAYDGEVSKLLMFATPNHGSYSSFRMLYDVRTIVTGLADLFFKDRASPAHYDMTPGSDFLRWLDAAPLHDLETPGTYGDYLVVAGYDDINHVGFSHTEIQSQDDGVVAVSSASLLDKGVPLVVVDHNHEDIYKQFDRGRTIEITQAFLSGGTEPDLSGSSSWYKCMIDELDDTSCSSIRDDVGLLNVAFPGVVVDEFLVETRSDGAGRLNVIANGRSISFSAQRLRRITGSSTFFSFQDNFPNANEITWELTERDFGYPSAGDTPYDLYYARQGLFSTPVIGVSRNALRTRYLSTVTATISLPQTAVDALNGVNSIPLVAKSASREIMIDGSVNNFVVVLNFEPDGGVPVTELIDPAGTAWTEFNIGGNPLIHMDLDAEVGYFVASVDHPVAGIWSLRHQEGPVVTASEVFVDADVAALLDVVSSKTLEPGDDLDVEVIMTSPETLTDSDVVLEYFVTAASGQKTIGVIDLVETGSGSYTGTVTVQDMGRYDLILSLSGTDAQGDTVVRFDMESVNVGWGENQVDLQPGEIAFFPNPMNPEEEVGTIVFDAATASVYSLSILDTAGHQVLSRDLGTLVPGEQRATWDGRGSDGELVANGLYFGVVTNESGDRLIVKIAALR